MATTVPTDGRCWWLGTHVGVPVNWSRDTAFDNKLLLGDGDSYTGPVNAGSVNHTHTVNSHTHPLADHQHDFLAGASPDGGSQNAPSGSPLVGRSAPDHDHTTIVSNFHDAATNTDATTVPLNAGSNFPGITGAIVIQPDDGAQDIPDDATAITDETTDPTGFSKIAGASNSRFFWAPTTGQDGGVTTALLHSHTGSTHSHTHTATHGHAGKRAGQATTPVDIVSGGGGTTRIMTHHVVTLSAASPGATGNSLADPTGVNIEPPFVGMLGITNTSGSPTTPLDVIIPYIGTPASVPNGWAYCDGSGNTPDLRSTFIRVHSVVGGIGSTGGSTTHSHDATDTHNHTMVAGHLHSTSVTTDQSVAGRTFGGNQILTTAAHTHTWGVESVMPSLAASGYTTSTDDHTPASRSVIFIKRIELSDQPQPALFFGCNF